MRIALVISSLTRGGGAERVMATIASYWAAQGWSITLVSLAKDTDGWYPLPAPIRVNCLDLVAESRGILDGLSKNARRIARLRQAIREADPNVVISFIDRMNVMTLAAAFWIGRPVIVGERNTPWRHNPGGLWKLLRCLLYPFAKGVVVQTESVRRGIWYVRRHRLHVIPNPAPVLTHGIPREEDLNATEVQLQSRLKKHPFILGVGRLDPAKGFDLLLKAFASVLNSFPECRLVILGEGPQRRALEKLAAELSVANNVYMPGVVKDPFAIMRDAHVFVLSSRYEGFPNVLVEAMTLGTASISFDCENGPADLIRDGENGLLVPPENVSALAKSICSLLDDDRRRQKLGAAAAGISDQFSVDKILTRWSDVVHTIARECPVQ